MGEPVKFPVVLSQTFIEATRDTGYRSTAAAVAELIDNAIQASAKNIRIFVREDGEELQLAILDDGIGMDSATLRRALQFGGSVRFGDRSGLGRFGMGLPNASVSQAKRVDVFTWKVPNACFGSHLDVDDIASRGLDEIPIVKRSTIPKWAQEFKSFSGTMVLWTRCDRLDNRRITTIARKLLEPLGRIFRHFLWRGVKIWVNDNEVAPIDPLFLNQKSPLFGAVPFGEPLSFEVRIPGHQSKTSIVTVRFSELPVAKWHDIPVEDKRTLRIIDGAGLSILRAGREVDYGWWFFGAKRRENYDSWWRGELSFEPELDELFAITHSKQGINPTLELREILTPDLEATARQLNTRVQIEFASVKTDAAKPIPAPGPTEQVEKRSKPHSPTRQRPIANEISHIPKTQANRVDSKNEVFTVSIEPISGKAIFKASKTGGRWRLILNSAHPFCQQVYEQLQGVHRKGIELLLIAFAQAEAECDEFTGNSLRARWAKQLAELLKGIS